MGDKCIPSIHYSRAGSFYEPAARVNGLRLSGSKHIEKNGKYETNSAQECYKPVQKLFLNHSMKFFYRSVCETTTIWPLNEACRVLCGKENGVRRVELKVRKEEIVLIC